jgi:hypothetical protein
MGGKLPDPVGVHQLTDPGSGSPSVAAPSQAVIHFPTSRFLRSRRGIVERRGGAATVAGWAWSVGEVTNNGMVLPFLGAEPVAALGLCSWQGWSVPLQVGPRPDVRRAPHGRDPDGDRSVNARSRASSSRP